MSMKVALDEAEKAGLKGEVPVGAALVCDGEIIAQAGNTKEEECDPTAHAEVNVIRIAAQKIHSWRLPNCTLYVTLEPCVLCAGAILAARIPRVIFGAWDEKAGAVGSQFDLLRERRFNHQVEVQAGVLEEECAAVLQKFFDARRSTLEN